MPLPPEEEPTGLDRIEAPPSTDEAIGSCTQLAATGTPLEQNYASQGGPGMVAIAALLAKSAQAAEKRPLCSASTPLAATQRG